MLIVNTFRFNGKTRRELRSNFEPLKNCPTAATCGKNAQFRSRLARFILTLQSHDKYMTNIARAEVGSTSTLNIALKLPNNSIKPIMDIEDTSFFLNNNE